ncbi:hypothetical protein [Nonomuraea sp. NPDC049141]|jgi:hypothetical protein|uniref:hypothetical protein n=1 Tax=unclassified Nonomuraea TaxID=2593643 RepID=UPI00340C3588
MSADLAALAATHRAYTPEECAELARQAAESVDIGALPRSGPGGYVLLWSGEHSIAWLNTWWEARDTGFHDHDGSAVGVYVLAGRVSNEGLPIEGTRRVGFYGAGESFSFPGTGIHRMDHEAGAITIHVYSPPLRGIGHYEVVDGFLRRTPGSPDEASPPSPGLREALGVG